MGEGESMNICTYCFSILQFNIIITERKLQYLITTKKSMILTAKNLFQIV